MNTDRRETGKGYTGSLDFVRDLSAIPAFRPRFKCHKSTGSCEIRDLTAARQLIFAAGRNLLRLQGAERVAAAGSAPYRIYVRKDATWLTEEKDRSRAVLRVMP